MRVPFILRLLFPALLLSACGSPYPVRQQPPAPVTSSRQGRPETIHRNAHAGPQGSPEVHAYRPPRSQVAAVRPPSSRAVRALMRRAASQRRAGDLAAARASLERALRIEPRNPHLWNRLAHLSLLQRAFARAEQFAAKANVLAQGDPALRADDWAVIAQARRAQGDLAGARAAARRARVVE